MESDFFEQLAPYYRDYARRRRAYLDAVDELVVQGIRGRTLLDVGSGDGSRIVKIACRAGVERLALCEPSAAMRRLCLEAGAAAALAEAESGGPVGAGAKRAREGDAGLDAAVPRQRATPAPQLDVLDLRAEDLDRLPERFESVTCLWNVLGHIPGRDVRVSSLRNMPDASRAAACCSST